MKWFYFLCGWAAVALAVLGAVLPLLPTTPFLLLAAFCFARSSPRYYAWLHENRYFGTYLSNYRNGNGLPWHCKVGVLLFLWLSLGVSILWGLSEGALLLRLFLLCVGLAVSYHILRLRTPSSDGVVVPKRYDE